MTIVISGLGCVSAYGHDLDALGEALSSATPRPTRVEIPENLPNAATGSLPAYAVSTSTWPGWLSPLEGRRMSRPSRFAVVAARRALNDAARPVADPIDSKLGIVVSTTFGPISATQRLVDQCLENGPEFMSPSTFTECVANAPAAHVSILCRAGGVNLTLGQREAGALGALSTGIRLVESGRVRQCIVGSTDEISPLLAGVLDGFGAVSHTRSRPFDAQRDGFVPAEGSTMLLVESAREAQARGVDPWCDVRAAESIFTPSGSSRWFGGDPVGTGRRIAERLRCRGIEPSSIDLVVSGASGSRAGDRFEALALRELFGDSAIPPVLAPKGVTGEYGGAFLAAAVLATRKLGWGPAAGFSEKDRRLGISPALDAPSIRTAGRLRVLTTTFSAAGHASWSITEADESDPKDRHRDSGV